MRFMPMKASSGNVLRKVDEYRNKIIRFKYVISYKLEKFKNNNNNNNVVNRKEPVGDGVDSRGFLHCFFI